MDENALIGLECPKCGRVHAETLAHLKAHWKDRFLCEQCGNPMIVDREELLSAIDSAKAGETLIVKMHDAG